MRERVCGEIVLTAAVICAHIIPYALDRIAAGKTRERLFLVVLEPVVGAEQVGDTLLLPGVIYLPMHTEVYIRPVAELLDSVGLESRLHVAGEVVGHNVDRAYAVRIRSRRGVVGDNGVPVYLSRALRAFREYK